MSKTYQSLVYSKSRTKDTLVYLANVELVGDCDTGYELDVTYMIETPERIQELHIPRVSLPIYDDTVHIFQETDDVPYRQSNLALKVNIGFGAMPVRTVDGVAYTVKTIKEKTKEMTLEEIEKKLGHKVKIISKEEETK